MSQNEISIEEALNLPNTIFIDVRSEDEFSEACIPGSINMPILKNEERIIVGKAYRNTSVEEAKSLGLQYASYKLHDYYNKVLELRDIYDNIVIYCWRGGMRSRSVCSVLNTMSMENVHQLTGGYKSYRKFVLDFLETNVEKYKFIVLHGLTGVGKTIIIDKLEDMGIPIINLEELAKNSGSVFGGILFEGHPPSQKQFESILFNSLYYNKNKYVVVESESKRIGSINIPDSVIKAMEDGYHLLIDTSLKNRVQNIYNDYVKKDLEINDKLIKAISHLNKRLGNKNVEMLIHKIENDDYAFAIEFLIENYYDPLYKYSINKFNKFDLSINYDNIDNAVLLVKEFIADHFKSRINQEKTI
ncbi:tRNA 2-selenouridine(34) synthase MnmH [Wukongibacter baidiensis]|uniref:tRNA 2-selenouridine(34) synthase MnmH n=1 Tax=Wukongibacter baidiensis TaxID=1723361 RepID=UPI003D7F2B4E